MSGAVDGSSEVNVGLELLLRFLSYLTGGWPLVLRPTIQYLRLHIIIKGVFLVDLFRKALDSSSSLREGRCFTGLYVGPPEVAAQAILLGMASAHLLGIWRCYIQSIGEVVGGESISWLVNLASTANHFTSGS